MSSIYNIIQLLGTVLFFLSTFTALTGMFVQLFDFGPACWLQLSGLSGMLLFSFPMNLRIPYGNIRR